MAQLIDLEAGIDCTSPNGKDGKQKLKFFWDLKKQEKVVFLFDHSAPKKHTKLCNEPHYQSTTRVSPCKGNHHYVL
jgi:homoaconitase/3-isopropylmalate dehydratase large subunit